MPPPPLLYCYTYLDTLCFFLLALLPNPPMFFPCETSSLFSQSSSSPAFARPFHLPSRENVREMPPAAVDPDPFAMLSCPLCPKMVTVVRAPPYPLFFFTSTSPHQSLFSSDYCQMKARSTRTFFSTDLYFSFVAPFLVCLEEFPLFVFFRAV